MFGFESIVCCSRQNYEEEYFSQDLLPDNKTRFPTLDYKDVLDDDEFTPESSLKKEQPVACSRMLTTPLTFQIVPQPAVTIRVHWSGGRFHTPLQDSFSILNDWAAGLHARHAKNVVHGNLTPESVDVVHGRGILLNHGSSPTFRAPSDEDLYGVRWAATELFRIDNGNPCPTMMSDVYSFACLMLQMLTGSVPYCGTKRPEQVVYLKYLGREPIDAQTPEVADRYVAFMRWCWSSEPENRPTMETVIGFIRDEMKRLGDQRG